jgi:hypothetical protein
MWLLNRIPRKYIALIPAAYFMLIGLISIIADLVSNDKLIWMEFAFYGLFMLPFILRNRIVYLITGTIFALLAGCISLELFSWYVDYLRGRSFSDPLATFGVGTLFATATIFCSLCLLYMALNKTGALNKSLWQSQKA